jgi:hypothetical protein
MSYTRPDEERLGTSGTTGYLLEFTGTGTAAWVTPPPSGITPHVLYAECNSPAATGGDDPLPWDTFYDESQSVISGAPLTAALAAMGLTLAANQFTTTADGIYGLELSYTPKAAPALQANTIQYFSSIFISDTGVDWGVGSLDNNPPARAELVIPHTIFLQSGDFFVAKTIATGTVTDGVITYAAMSIMKLV